MTSAEAAIAIAFISLTLIASAIGEYLHWQHRKYLRRELRKSKLHLKQIRWRARMNRHLRALRERNQ